MPLQLRVAPGMLDLLRRAGASEQEGKQCTAGGAVEWRQLKAAAQTLRDKGEHVDLSEVCRSGSLVLEPPAKREVSPEFRAELDRRKRAAERAAYQRLVEDVAPGEGDTGMSAALPTTKLQIGQGVHMAVTMGLGYALGSQFGASLSEDSTILKPMGGVVGVIVALIFETVLFIVRVNMHESESGKYNHLLEPEKAKLRAQQPTPMGEPFMTQPSSKKKLLIESKKEQ